MQDLADDIVRRRLHEQSDGGRTAEPSPTPDVDTPTMDADGSRELRRLRIETAALRAELQVLHERVRAAEDDVEVARAVYRDADAENRMLRTVMAEHRLGELAWLGHDELVAHILHLGHEPPDAGGRGGPAQG